MNEHILNNINSLVKPEDSLFLLGDLLFRFKNVEDYWNLLDRFNCNNIYLVFGNHDNEKNLIECKHPKIQFLGDYLEIQVNDRLICMSHYAFRVWNKSHHGSWMLYGHSHSNLNSQGKQLDVGIDNYFKMFGEYKPFNYYEINSFMEKQPIWLEDHHSKNTN